MTPKVKPKIIKERAKILQTLAGDLAKQYRSKLTGKTERVLIESVKDGIAIGRAERYFEVKILNPQNKIRINDIVEITLTG